LSALRPRRRASRWLGLTGLALVVLAAGCSSITPSARPKALTSKTTTTLPPPVCPLTGAPPASGSVPQLPALAVKVDNYPDARPQSGLDKADIVFEEPVEGGITRYVAIFQCQQAPLVGPIRSARNIDIGILGQFGQPLLVSVGGIQPVLDNIAASPIKEFDLRTNGSIVQNLPDRYAPYDTYSSTQSMWLLDPSDTAAPAPVFSYSPSPTSGSPVQSFSIAFSTGLVVWTYDPQSGQFLRSYGTMPDKLADGIQNSASNVIVQYVSLTYGPWLENDVGGLEVQANLYQDASGQAEVFRNGVQINGTWQRNSLGEPTQYLTSIGTPIAMAPGPTWVELVPTNVQVSTTS
jgi:hypothetical protein